MAREPAESEGDEAGQKWAEKIRTVNLIARVPESMKNKLKEIAQAQGMSLGELVRIALAFYIRDLELRDRYGPGFVGTSDQRRERGDTAKLADDLIDDEAFLEALAEKLREREKEEGE
jgi:hypothetical protein